MGNRLFVGNLSFDATTESLRATFAAVGDVDDVAVITDRETGRPRGFGFVTMSSSEDAQRAISELNGATLDGRQLRVNEAEERSSSSRGPGGGGGRGGDRDRKGRW